MRVLFSILLTAVFLSFGVPASANGTTGDRIYLITVHTGTPCPPRPRFEVSPQIACEYDVETQLLHVDISSNLGQATAVLRNLTTGAATFALCAETPDQFTMPVETEEDPYKLTIETQSGRIYTVEFEFVVVEE